MRLHLRLFPESPMPSDSTEAPRSRQRLAYRDAEALRICSNLEVEPSASRTVEVPRRLMPVKSIGPYRLSVERGAKDFPGGFALVSLTEAVRQLEWSSAASLSMAAPP